jgi:signal transduction histidine kinase
LLASGDYTARTNAPRNDEIGELSRAFNAMAEKIDAQRRQLVAANEHLEEKVQQRTGELNAANDRLRAEMAEKEDFLRAVSHDLNAPLRNIAGMVTMILMKHQGELPEDVLKRLDRIQANVQAETDLIGELLELSRIKTRPQRREVVDMAAMLTDLAGAFEFDLSSKGIKLAIDGPMPALYVEPNRLRQVFQNLIDNAVKYMPADHKAPRIEVSYELDGDEHRFGVSDNGAGIDPEDQQRIFYVFRRAASADAGTTPGKGVGLASVKSIVSNYDGRVWVESQPGQGATFFVTLSVRQTETPEKDVTHDEQDNRAAAVDYHPVG